jgi:hypothetical protein
MRLALIPIMALLALLPIAVTHYVLAQGPIQSVEIRVSEDGVATVTLVASVDAGVTAIELPVDPIAVTIDVNSSVSGVEWMLEDGYLYIASPSQSTVKVTYIANASVENGVITLSVRTNATVRLVLAPTILLLTLPENVVSTTTLPGGELEIIFRGPATISYTIAQPITTTTIPTTITKLSTTTSPSLTTASSMLATTTTATSSLTSFTMSTPSPVTTPTTQTTLPTAPTTTTQQTATPTIAITSPTTFTQTTPITQVTSPSTTTTQASLISLSTIVAIAIIIAIIAIIALVIRRR